MCTYKLVTPKCKSHTQSFSLNFILINLIAFPTSHLHILVDISKLACLTISVFYFPNLLSCILPMSVKETHLFSYLCKKIVGVTIDISLSLILHI